MSRAPLRGTQSLVGQMGWVKSQPLLFITELAWRWLFGVPFLAVFWDEYQKLLVAVPPDSAGLDALDGRNPWVAAVQVARAWSLYQPHVVSLLLSFAPLAAIAWIIVSALGRSVVLRRLIASSGHAPSGKTFRPLAMMVLQAAWLVVMVGVWLGWFCSVEWAAGTHFPSGAEPDLIGFAIWLIFFSLGFYTLCALVSWPFSVAPLIMLSEERSPLSALRESLRLGREFTAKLVEINMVMGITNLALIVLAMVFSAAPLPFGDELGSDALHLVDALAVLFYLVSTDYFQLVRLKGFAEFWKMFRGPKPFISN